ncbi:MAG: phosphoglycolate phosphatase [Bacillota bacterium]
MKKKVLKSLFIFCCSVLLIFIAYICIVLDYGTPDEFNKENWPQTKETAIEATINFFKKEKNMDVTIDNVSSSGEFATHEIYIEGYVTDDKQQRISATVDSSEGYKVRDVTITTEN